VKKAQIPRLLRAAKHLGFSEAEFAVSGDHRQIRALEIIARDLERKDKAAAAVEALKPKLPKGQKPEGRKQTDSQKKRDVIKRGKGGTPDQQRAAITALLG
jgi:lipase chaperone LimK